MLKKRKNYKLEVGRKRMNNIKGKKKKKNVKVKWKKCMV
jgi:hypothetical protein